MIGLGRRIVPGWLRRRHVLLWVSNAGAMEMTANSIASARRAGLGQRGRCVLAVFDDAEAALARRLAIRARIINLGRIDEWRKLDLDISDSYSDFDTDAFRRVCLARYFAISHVLRRDCRPVIYTDGDIVFLRDPCACFRKLQPAHDGPVLVQNDRRADLHSHEWSHDYSVGQLPARSVICAGFSVWTPTPRHLHLIEAIVRAMLAEAPMPSDQTVFNQLGDDLLAQVKLLRQDLFPNGSLCFHNRYLPSQPIEAPAFDWSDAYIVHANWMIGIQTKIAALKEARLWFL